MAGKEVWFKNAEGVDFACNEGSVAHSLMSKDGAFTQIDGPGGAEVETAFAPDPNAAPVPVDRSKMTKAELVAEAESLEIDTVPDKATKQQIIDLIEAKIAESEGASE